MHEGQWDHDRELPNEVDEAQLFVDELLAGLEEAASNAAEEGDYRPEPVFGDLNRRAKQMTLADLVAVFSELAQVIYQIRAWYTRSAGDLILVLLRRISNTRTSLPRIHEAVNPGLVVLKVLEGVVLVSTGPDSPKEVADILDKLLTRRVLPSGCTYRLEATLACLLVPAGTEAKQWNMLLQDEPPRNGIPIRLPLEHETDDGDEEAFLEDLLIRLRPDTACLKKIDRAKKAVENVVAEVFAGCHPEYFGSAVNGFETSASDVDCVVRLPEETIERLLSNDPTGAVPRPTEGFYSEERRREKQAAVLAVKELSKALEESKELKGMGIMVVEVVTEARVPVLKCASTEGIAVDISFNNTLPLHNSKLLRAYADLDARIADLGRLIKHWAKQRGVNDALDGTLSSYSHVLLVLHFLQRVRLAPNLQQNGPTAKREAADRASCRLDGKHDVWFLDPTLHQHDACPELQDWLKFAPENATLLGLLSGFFRYFAYEFPAYSDVVSITHPQGRLSKVEYFRQLAFQLETEAVEPEEGHADAAQAGEDVDDGEEGMDEEEEEAFPKEDGDEPADADGVSSDDEALVLQMAETAQKEDEEVLAQLVDTAQKEQQADAPSETKAAQPEQAEQLKLQKRKLEPLEQAAQWRLSGRQLLCIEDPMELGRTLGVSFQGMERLVYEWRRACHLLSCQQSQMLKEVFSGKPPKTLARLADADRTLPRLSAKVGEQKTVPVNQKCVDRLLGNHGALIKTLHNAPGIQYVRVTKDKKEVMIRGDHNAVQECWRRLADMCNNNTYSSRKAHDKAEAATRRALSPRSRKEFKLEKDKPSRGRRGGREVDAAAAEGQAQIHNQGSGGERVPGDWVGRSYSVSAQFQTFGASGNAGDSGKQWNGDWDKGEPRRKLELWGDSTDDYQQSWPSLADGRQQQPPVSNRDHNSRRWGPQGSAGGGNGWDPNGQDDGGWPTTRPRRRWDGGPEGQEAANTWGGSKAATGRSYYNDKSQGGGYQAQRGEQSAGPDPGDGQARSRGGKGRNKW